MSTYIYSDTRSSAFEQAMSSEQMLIAAKDFCAPEDDSAGMHIQGNDSGAPKEDSVQMHIQGSDSGAPKEDSVQMHIQGSVSGAPKEYSVDMHIQGSDSGAPKEDSVDMHIQGSDSGAPKEDSVDMHIQGSVSGAPKEDSVDMHIQGSVSGAPKEDSVDMLIAASDSGAPKEDSVGMHIQRNDSGAPKEDSLDMHIQANDSGAPKEDSVDMHIQRSDYCVSEEDSVDMLSEAANYCAPEEYSVDMLISSSDSCAPQQDSMHIFISASDSCAEVIQKDQDVSFVDDPVQAQSSGYGQMCRETSKQNLGDEGYLEFKDGLEVPIITKTCFGLTCMSAPYNPVIFNKVTAPEEHYFQEQQPYLDTNISGGQESENILPYYNENCPDVAHVLEYYHKQGLEAQETLVESSVVDFKAIEGNYYQQKNNHSNVVKVILFNTAKNTYLAEENILQHNTVQYIDLHPERLSEDYFASDFSIYETEKVESVMRVCKLHNITFSDFQHMNPSRVYTEHDKFKCGQYVRVK